LCIHTNPSPPYRSDLVEPPTEIVLPYSATLYTPASHFVVFEDVDTPVEISDLVAETIVLVAWNNLRAVYQAIRLFGCRTVYRTPQTPF
jgi:hypothetical protein